VVLLVQEKTLDCDLGHSCRHAVNRTRPWCAIGTEMAFGSVDPHGSMLRPRTIKWMRRGVPRTTQILRSSRNVNPIEGLAQRTPFLETTTSVLFPFPVPHQVASGKNKPGPPRYFHRRRRYRGQRRRTHFPKDPAHVRLPPHAPAYGCASSAPWSTGPSLRLHIAMQ